MNTNQNNPTNRRGTSRQRGMYIDFVRPQAKSAPKVKPKRLTIKIDDFSVAGRTRKRNRPSLESISRHIRPTVSNSRPLRPMNTSRVSQAGSAAPHAILKKDHIATPQDPVVEIVEEVIIAPDVAKTAEIMLDDAIGEMLNPAEKDLPKNDLEHIDAFAPQNDQTHAPEDSFTETIAPEVELSSFEDDISALDVPLSPSNTDSQFDDNQFDGDQFNEGLLDDFDESELNEQDQFEDTSSEYANEDDQIIDDEYEFDLEQQDNIDSDLENQTALGEIEDLEKPVNLNDDTSKQAIETDSENYENDILQELKEVTDSSADISSDSDIDDLEAALAGFADDDLENPVKESVEDGSAKKGQSLDAEKDAPDGNRYSLGGRSPFLRSVNVDKRPLSGDGPAQTQTVVMPDSVSTPAQAAAPIIEKNIYNKSEPVNSKPEKSPKKETIIIPSVNRGSNLGLVLAIAVTIILGAVAGAFVYLAFFQ